jgi:hypothetical protein
MILLHDTYHYDQHYNDDKDYMSIYQIEEVKTLHSM